MATEPKVTEEQAGQALFALMAASKGQEAPAPEPEVAAAEPSTEQAAEPAETATESTGETAETSAAPTEQASDDIESLRKRLAEIESTRDAAIKAEQARVEAVEARARQNEQILRERMLKKASVADRALKALEQARSAQGIPEAEVDRVIAEIRGSMNPQSPNYAPPPDPAPMNPEDQAIVLNAFLNEKRLTNDEAEEFGKWMRTEASSALSPVEAAVAQRDLDGFLRIAHTRFLEGVRDNERKRQKDEAVQAVKVVQQTQKAAARAATASPSAIRKPSVAGSRAVDLKKLTSDDVSALLRAAVEENR